MKEQTAPGLSELERLSRAPIPARTPRMSWPPPARWHKTLVGVLFVALALLATTGYGAGLQLNDGNVVLHLLPFKFLEQLLHAWNPSFSLGTPTGYWVPYETPYGWAYGLAALVHLSQEHAQRACLFLVYLGCEVSMYYCLRSLAPWLDEVAKVAGSCAYLFNMYVALNSQAQIVWLLTYATLPALVGVTARAMRGEMGAWRAALGVALLVFVGAGVNPPLVAINVVILAIFVVVTVVFDPNPRLKVMQALPFVAAASVATVAINLYWLVPFVDYFHDVWLNGVLSESPSMHNAATSFSNVMRGLGHWATFISFNDRPYFPWGLSYAAGFFGGVLWLIPIIALAGVAFKRNRSLVTLFFLLVTIVSIPFVVGYYHDELGDAITSSVYNLFYRDVPGFQMFRFSYKWVAGVQFGMCGLYALAVGAILTASRERLMQSAASVREQYGWTVPAAGVAFVLLPILLYVPVLQRKANYPGAVIPSWEYQENRLLGDDRSHRVAIFPTQYLELFDWGSPEFYIEDAFVDRPIIYGRLGVEYSEGVDHWIRGAYRATRFGSPLAADMFHVLNVDTILQRDDFIPAIDFSFPDYYVSNSATLTHDLLHRVVGAQPVRSSGPLRVYHLAGALPLVYGVVHPKLSSLPPFSDAYLGDVRAMAKGAAEFTLPAHPSAQTFAQIESLAPILPATDHQVRDLAVDQSLAGNGTRIHPPSADITLFIPFTLKSTGRYLVFAREDSPLFYRPTPVRIDIDGQSLSPQSSGGAWTDFGAMDLNAGSDHTVTDGYPDSSLTVALVKPDALHAWEDRIGALQHALPNNLSATRFVNARQTRVLVAQAGRYRVDARAAIPLYWQDTDVHTRLLRDARSAASFLTALSPTLPYVLGSGTATTAPAMMPESWYENPSVYRWQRGDPMSWFLFSRDAHVLVFVPGSDGVIARARLRISRLQVSPVMRVAIDGRAPRSIVLPVQAAAADEYDTRKSLAGPGLASLEFPLALRPGWNDVAFGFDPLAGERTDLGTDVIAAAVGPDLSFTRVARLASPPAGEQPQAGLSVVGVASPPFGLTGDPELRGNAVDTAGRVSLAVAIAERGRIAYRIIPIASDGDFAIRLLSAFSNDWNDVSKRIVGMWLVSRAAQPYISQLLYRQHGMPTISLSHPNAFESLPVVLDGKAVGAAPVFLSQGEHLVETAEQKLKIERLTVDPANLPKTTSFGLTWKRSSPTRLEVGVKNASRPFLLVFGEMYHPQWEATLDGKTLTHVAVNGVENGWLVPRLPAPGSNIVLSFTLQRNYDEAAVVSLVSLIVLIALAYAPKRLRRSARGS